MRSHLPVTQDPSAQIRHILSETQNHPSCFVPTPTVWCSWVFSCLWYEGAQQTVRYTNTVIDTTKSQRQNANSNTTVSHRSNTISKACCEGVAESLQFICLRRSSALSVCLSIMACDESPNASVISHKLWKRACQRSHASAPNSSDIHSLQMCFPNSAV